MAPSSADLTGIHFERLFSKGWDRRVKPGDDEKAWIGRLPEI
jgi:hypothetical protein